MSTRPPGKSPKLKVMFYLAAKTEDLGPGGSLSDRSERLLQEAREELGYIGVLQQRPGSQNIERLLLIKENQTSQGNKFGTFLCM